MFLPVPTGMNRRHFMRHLAGAAAIVPTLDFLSHLQANAAEAKKSNKACILIWLQGGAPTIDIWDLKPGSKNGGEFKPIDTKGDLQISEHMPKTAMVMNHLSVVRAMSTREADHGRGTYFMHTGYVPNPTVVHPAFGSVVSYEIGAKRKELDIPAFVAVGGAGGNAGFLGMSHAPFRVDATGRVRNADMDDISPDRLKQRLSMLEIVEDGFIQSQRGEFPQAHKDIYGKAVNLMTSKQMEAFKVDQEKPETLAMYDAAPTQGAGMMGGRGNGGFSRSLVLARRLVEAGVPFVEVDGGSIGNWDLHGDVFNSLKNTNLPQLDAGIAGLTTDLEQRGMLKDTMIVCMAEFGRTPRINQGVGRDHWAATWSVMIGGGGLKGGVAVGETDKDGLTVASGKSYLPGDIWATVARQMGIPLDTVHQTKRGRPMKVANGGTPIQELIA